MNEELTYKEKLFCFSLVKYNNRIKALEEAGYCERVVNLANEEGRKYNQDERNILYRSASNLLKKEKIKNQINIYVEEKFRYLGEHGICDEIEVLRYLSDIIKEFRKKPEDVFKAQWGLKASEILLNYYNKSERMIKVQESQKTNKYIIEFKEKAKKEDKDGTNKVKWHNSPNFS